MTTTSLLRQARGEIAAGRPDAAFALLDAAPTLADDPAALQLFAALGLGTGRHATVRQRLQVALTLRPRDPGLLGLAAAAAHGAGDRRTALVHASQALAIDPAEHLAAPIVVEALADALQVSEAIRVSEACLQRDPDAWGVRLSRLFAWMCAGEGARALADAEIARAAAPHSLPALMNCALAALYLDEPAQATFARHAAVAAAIPGLPGKAMVPRAPYRAGVRPLRVGFVSSDLRRHPVGLFTAPVFRHLDPRRVHAVVYSDGEADAHTAVLRALAPDWHDTRALPDAALFDLIQQHRIDVLVDLSGYTAGARVRLLATRCAPRQVGYLGYLHPTGMATRDGVIGDVETLDADGRVGFEPPLRLPGHLLCYEPPLEAPSVKARAAGAIRFGSFNHLAKLSPATVALWSRLLQACPGSTLTLCALGLSDPGVQLLVTRRFAAAGIDASRLRLLPPELDPTRFLARYAGVDVALDPLPFNGGTTSLQALWQGVPVLTLPGDRMASRMGRSMLRAIGLDEMVARDEADFVRIGTHLAQDAAALAALRTGLRGRMRASGLVDGARFADAFTRVLEQSAGPRLSGTART